MKTTFLMIILLGFTFLNAELASAHMNSEKNKLETKDKQTKKGLGQRIKEKVVLKLLKKQKRKIEKRQIRNQKRIAKGKKPKKAKELTNLNFILFILYFLLAIGIVVWAVLAFIVANIAFGIALLLLGLIALVFVPVIFIHMIFS